MEFLHLHTEASCSRAKLVERVSHHVAAQFTCCYILSY